MAEDTAVTVGAERTDTYLPLLAGKKVAVMTNHTGRVGKESIVDMLVSRGIDVRLIFAPEHGFRGTAAAGEPVEGGRDASSGIAIASLYDGHSHKPSATLMKSFDVLLIDIQDVGVRFYTYHITMINIMEACAAAGKPVIVLDRPNPLGHYIDGPILEERYRSGVGQLPIPVVHGMTLGELAMMANGEGWLANGLTCRLTVIRCLGYTHATRYRLPLPPSPNLPNMTSVYLYPSLCLFEGTPVSLGRGTAFPFQVYGHPNMIGAFHFTPRSMQSARHPLLEGRLCNGVDLRSLTDEELWDKRIDLSYLIDAYQQLARGNAFFSPFFEKLMGVAYVRDKIISGADAAAIRALWQTDVEKFRLRRRPYLLYDE